MRILFINKTRAGEFRSFDHSNLEGMRGGERTVMYLADALSRRGHDVVVARGDLEGEMRAGNIVVAGADAALSRSYDIAVSNNFAAAFDGVNALAKIVWTHNPGYSWAHVRADYLAKHRYQPYLVHLSRFTLVRSRLLPRSGQTIIRHGIPDELIAARRERSEPPEPIAVFSSYAGRNLGRVIKAWRDVVHSNVPAARLLITAEVERKHLGGVAREDLGRLNIEIVGTQPWSQLMELFRRARVFVAPGHRQETFNLLSIEAAACGVPTVTLGIGALRERVLHDATGWIARSDDDMGASIARILTDDASWWRYHRACLEHPDLVNWEARAAEWEAYMETVSS